ncbi:rho guanine nucleotide exchange factor 11-like isoform X3 [Eriocheir sinensis]|uniref:rho guanine nucleotide exchange factor 11-like isoform X3 n=1 Tax=Eriocheir sinensis TaxID=95602 RepID=UPI0021C8770F|nr:rho guanine nucleotide exchange factor 11-like isoform X3 [Eriocheir sinensis]
MDERLELIEEGNDDRPSDSSSLRNVVIHRGDHGYGLTVSGESPVIVQDVKDGGPAAQAGVKKGDSIIKVNGTIVSKINHREVVQIIKSANQCVKLTLQSCPEGEVPQDVGHRQLPLTPNPSKYNDRITAPLPVNTQLQNQMEANKGKMLTKYLEKQRRVKDNIMVELQRGPSKVLQRNLEKELESINRQIAKIQEELKNMKDSEAQSVSSVSEPGSRPQSHYRAKSSPDPLGLHTCHGYQGGSDSVNDISVTGPCSSQGKASSSICSDDTISTSTFTQEPPGTPPPPYASTSQLCPTDEVDENYSIIPDDCDGGGDYPPSAPPLPPPPGPCLPSRPTLPGLPPKPGSHPASPFSSQVTSPTSPNGQVVSPTCTVLPSPSQPILSMEDEEFSDTETLEDHGPFQSLSKLWNHNAYLAVFMNYVISNCDPSSLFFYVITHLYKEGVGKDMKRWAYEITSSFLLPGAPLRLCNVEESILHEIDETLQNELDKEEILRKVFWKARMRCREDLNEQLADFRNKRSAGLGSIFGPADHLLEESIHNKPKELQIVEHLLVPCLDSVSDDLKNSSDQRLVTASSLATILLKYYMVRSPQAQQLIDRCPMYVSKERPLRSKIFRGNKKQVFRDHHFNQHTYYSVTYCNHCGLIIWGIAPQGYQCTNCEMNIHKSCAKQVEEVCIGQLHKKDRSRDTRFSAILGKIISDEGKRKISHINAAQIEKARKGYEEGNTDLCGLGADTDSYSGECGLS